MKGETVMSDGLRFVMIGGFLGAGKTTTIARLARHYQSQGKRVAIVTNDQATDLVDTNLLRAQGFDVGEVAGSCFCCNFNELTRTVECLSADERPDVVIAEPVGSCTDLVATVIRPLRQIYNQPISVAPYGVIIKPSHGMKILRKTGKGGFSPQAEYIFRKQIEEADFVILNRIDELSREAIDEITSLLATNFNDIPCVQMSATTGQGFEDLCAYLEKEGLFGTRVMDVDYDVYAAGEAELGWLNSQATVQSDVPFDLDALMVKLLEETRNLTNAQSAEIAHMKVIGMSDGAYSVANLIASSLEPQLSMPSHAQVKNANVVINARVAIDPDALTEAIRTVVQRVSDQSGLRTTIHTLQSFRPGRPVPTHRLVT